MNATEKDNVFYCDCGFSWQRGMSGSHNCEDGFRAKLTDLAVQLANAESKCRALAVENAGLKKALTTIANSEEFHGDTVVCDFDTLVIAAWSALSETSASDVFLAELRASARNEGINYVASRLAAAFNHGFVDKPLAEVCDIVRMILDAKTDLANAPIPAADGLSGEYAEKAIEEWAAQLRKGSAL